MSIEELTKLVESMNQRMIGMQEFMKDQAQEIDELRRELKTTTTSSISTGSVTRSAVDDKETKKQLAKDAAETAKLAKEAVPKLLMATPGNYEKWKERLQEVFKLRSYREIAKFLSGIGLESVTGIVKKEEVKVGSSSSSSTPISTHAAPTISDEAAENFFAFLTSKLDDEFGSIVREANKCASASLRLKQLWSGIQRNFLLNTAAVREAKMAEWYALQQEPDESFKKYIDRSKKLQTVINEMFAPILHHEKVDDSDVLAKVKRLNPFYMEMMKDTITAMQTKRKEYTVQEWITNLEVVESQYNVTNPERIERANMARTTTAIPVQPGHTFRTVANTAQAKQEWLCNKFDGKPGSCPYAEKCHFKHETNPQIRKAHLKKVKERADQYKKKKEDKEKEKSAKNAPTAAATSSAPPAKASAASGGGGTDQKYVAIARALVAMLDNTGTTEGKTEQEERRKEKEEEKRKEVARKVRKKVADSRYEEYDVDGGYGLTSRVEEEYERDCSHLYCLSTKIEVESKFDNDSDSDSDSDYETKVTPSVKLDERLEKKNKQKKQKEYIQNERRAQSIRDKVIEKERREKEEIEEEKRKTERTNKAMQINILHKNTTHTRKPTTRNHNKYQCSSVSASVTQTFSIAKLMMYAMIVMLGCSMSGLGIEVGLGASMCGYYY